MSFPKTDKIWHNGKLINWDDAQIHVLSHVIHYGSSLFEGIRCYETPAGPAIFRLKEHIERLFNSCKIYRMEVGFPLDAIMEAHKEVVRVNRMTSCYLRPVVLRGYGDPGVNPVKCPVEVYIACWDWGKYLGHAALEQGVNVCVSSWARIAPNTLPAMAKAGANYMNSQLIRLEAMVNGYDEGIALDVNGFVSEGSGENIFVVNKGKIYTPPLGSSVLPGITRDSVIRLAEELKYPVIEQAIAREMLYISDEVFFCGTAAEITPVCCVDKITVGDGRRGPITKVLQEAFFAIIEGTKPDRFGWLYPVNEKQPMEAGK